MNNRINLFVSILFTIVSISVNGQETFINENWNLISGFIGQELKIASRISPNGELVYLSNHIQGTTSSDIYLSCVDDEGNVIWDVTCPSTQGYEDYGTALEIDAIGNIYVCAAKSNLSNLDFWMAKYNESGVLIWEQNYVGSGNGDDVPLDIVLDANDNPVITGVVWNGSSSNDMVAIKLNGSNGDILWSSEQILNLDQQAYSVQIDSNNDIVIGGVSSDSLVYGGVHLVKFDGTNGNEIVSNTIYSSQTGIDAMRKLMISQNGEIILVGSSNLNTLNSDIMIMSLNTNLQPMWTQYKDRDGAMDEVLDFTLNSNDEIVCTGYTSKLSGGQEIWIAKVDPLNGNIIWEFEKTAKVDTDYVRGKSITTDADNNVYVTGVEYRDGQEQFITISLDDNGEFNWARYFTNSDQSSDFAEKIQIDESGQVYVTGVSIENSQPAISTVSYTFNDNELTIVFDANNKPLRVKSEVILQFNPDIVKPSMFDDRRKTTGILTEFIQDSILLELEAETMMDWTRFDTRKLFRKYTMSDTLSRTRLGDTIRTSDFWATVVVNLPPEVDESAIATSVDNLAGVKYACTNDIAVPLSTNDSLYLYNQMLSLLPNSTYPGADINVEGAWDDGFVGEEFVKVGVFDDLIDWSHVEFGSTQTLSGSKIEGGYDYFYDAPIDFLLTNTGTHGTKVAGIIGAFRNNSAGIAGIAGGDGTVLNNGVALYSMAISFDTLFATTETISNAIHDGAFESIHPDSLGFGLHLQNHSWGTSENDVMEEAVRECWRNHCILVAAIGNENNSSANYPASYSDRQVLNVIASGTDGERKNGSINGHGNWGSSFGWDGSSNITKVTPDFMAPGVREMVSTTTAFWDNTSTTTAGCNMVASEYRCFDGSSAAAPHVTGVAALMYSEHHPSKGYPNPLTTEDVEEILQATSIDKDVVGYDYQSGHGLINAQSALEKVSDPYYVVHKTYNRNDATEFWHANGTNVPQFGGPNPIFHDQVDAFKYIWIIEDTLPTGHQVVDAWEVNAAWNCGDSIFQGSVTYIPEHQYPGGANFQLNFVTGSNMVSGYAQTVIYKITDFPGNGLPPVVSWYPFNPNDIKFQYSIHVNSNPTLSLNESLTDEIKLFPNPNTGSFSVSFNSQTGEDSKISITDALGKVVMETELKSLNVGVNKVDLELYGLQHGVYYCTLRSEEGIKTIPFIKTN